MRTIDNEKIVELSTDILTALIAAGFIPAAVAGKDSEQAAGMIEDYLAVIAQRVISVYRGLEQDEA